MADVAGDLKTWSATAASNSPAGGTAVGTGLDDNLRELQKVVRQDLATKGSDVASATSTDIGAVAGLMHDITGTTTITGLGTVSAGIWKIIKFEDALTLTHNATSLILPGAANITTADGDIGIFISEGSGNWRCVEYTRASGKPVVHLTSTSAVSTSSGTSVSLTTSIPTWAKRITLMFDAVSTDGTDALIVQVGDAGGVESSDYVSESALLVNAGSTGVSSSTAGFVIRQLTASGSLSGHMTITLSGTSNTWIESHSCRVDTTNVVTGAGKKATSATLDRISITTTGGTDAFDGGSITVMWE